MKFQDLPVSVQEIVAKTLGEMMLRPDNKKEPAELAREVKTAFSGLFFDAETPVRDEPFGGCGRNLPQHSKIALEIIQLELIKPEPLEDRSMQLLNTLQQVLQGSGMATGTLASQSYSHQPEQ